ncbi:MAG TPA: DUF6236 family protein, partial [Amycolatopsis sp.]|nr:DUF6236 family protein [Amycolatopsis sp.]
MTGVYQHGAMLPDADRRGVPVDPIALYYPYIHVRDDTWLKYAALYWPKLARLRPEGYPTLDSPVSRALREEAGWLLDVTPPPWAALRIGNQFLKLIAEHSHELRARFGVDRSPHDEYVLNLGALRRRPRRSVEPSSVGPDAPPWHAYVHSTKLSTTLLDAAVDAGLATTLQGRGGVWAGMHPELASVYTCALVEHIAAENHLHPITDQELPHSAASG